MANRNSRLLNFIISYASVVVVGFIVLWLTDIWFGKEDPGFYQIVIPGLFLGALIIALITSKQRNWYVLK